MCKDIRNDLAILNNAKMNENPRKAIKHFRNIIREFSAVKQLSVGSYYEINAKIALIQSSFLHVDLSRISMKIIR